MQKFFGNTNFCQINSEVKNINGGKKYMATKEFKTKTILMKRKNLCRKEGFWPIALDVGYSALKGMSPNSVFCFPSFAKRVKEDDIMLGQPEDSDIFYKDLDTNEIFLVGERAQATVSAKSSNETNSSLYGRNRYFSSIFKIVTRTGLGLALMDNEYGSASMKKIVLQTGLPPRYLRDDTPLLKEALATTHNFAIRVGRGDWQNFTVTLEKEDIQVMQQPMGTLLSIASNNDGHPTLDAKKLFQSKVLVFDPGFGTVDSCYIKERTIDMDDCLTFDNYGMRRVLQETCNTLNAKYGAVMTVPAIQPCLETGFVRVISRLTRSSQSIPFEPILREESKKVCMEALHKLEEIYDYLIETDYLVITGGLGAAWNDIIREHFKNMTTLQILDGNRNDNLPHIFSNVRGYYLYLASTL